MLTVKSCITNTVHVHQRDSDYQMRYKYVQTHIYIQIYLQAWIVSGLNANSWAEQFKRTKVKLAFTDAVGSNVHATVIPIWLVGMWSGRKWKCIKKTTVAASVDASLAHRETPRWRPLTTQTESACLSTSYCLWYWIICIRYRTFTKCKHRFCLVKK